MSKQYLIHLPPLFLVAVVGFVGYFTWQTINSPLPYPTPAALVTSTPTLTSTATFTPTPTATFTPTPTPTNTATATSTATSSPMPEPETKIIIPLNLIARQRPNLQAVEAVWLPEGVQVSVNGRNIAGTWLNVTDPDGQSGWVTVPAAQADEQGIDIDELEIILSSPPSPTPIPGIIPVGTILPPDLPESEIILLSPIAADGRFFSDVDFVWEWDGEELPPKFGFELLIWEPRETPTSAHNAVEDNRNGKIQDLGGGRYRFNLDVTFAPGVRGRQGVYRWTVRLVRIEPTYDDLGDHPIVAEHKEFSFGLLSTDEEVPR